MTDAVIPMGFSRLATRSATGATPPRRRHPRREPRNTLANALLGRLPSEFQHECHRLSLSIDASYRLSHVLAFGSFPSIFSPFLRFHTGFPSVGNRQDDRPVPKSNDVSLRSTNYFARTPLAFCFLAFARKSYVIDRKNYRTFVSHLATKAISTILH